MSTRAIRSFSKRHPSRWSSSGPDATVTANSRNRLWQFFRFNGRLTNVKDAQADVMCLDRLVLTIHEDGERQIARAVTVAFNDEKMVIKISLINIGYWLMNDKKYNGSQAL